MIDIQHLVCKFSVYQSSTFTESDVFSFTNYVELKRYCPCCFAPFSLFALQRFGLECIQNSYSRKKHLRTKIRFIRIMVITRAVPMIVSNWHALYGSYCFKENVESNYSVPEILKVIKFFNSKICVMKKYQNYKIVIHTGLSSDILWSKTIFVIAGNDGIQQQILVCNETICNKLRLKTTPISSGFYNVPLKQP